ncbi:MAG TPA: MotA/TolQ/ExbB proton channel family protein [Verrucomicrobiae bacterium]|nr:MotA/TolQ/ExbB proton channel family protein [Verrucomicrobiae bacterium]
MNWSALEFFTKGGIFMIPLLVCSVASLMIIIERGVALRRSRLINAQVATAVETLAIGTQPQALAQLVAKDSSSLSRLVATALQHLDEPRAANVDAVQMQARHEVVLLERGLVVLEIITGIGPLLGLLGTVSGLVHIFQDIGSAGLGDQGMGLARGISEALNTTVMGLVIAIPSLVFWSYYSRKIESVAAEMEALLGELIGKLYKFSGV